MTDAPTQPAKLNGNHDTRGKFAPGNKAGRGNPLNKRAQRLRASLLREVTPQDQADIARALIDKAKTGDVLAIREFYDRTIGKTTQLVDITTGGAGDGSAPPFDFAAFAALFRRNGSTEVARELGDNHKPLQIQTIEQPTR